MHKYTEDNDRVTQAARGAAIRRKARARGKDARPQPADRVQSVATTTFFAPSRDEFVAAATCV